MHSQASVFMLFKKRKPIKEKPMFIYPIMILLATQLKKQNGPSNFDKLVGSSLIVLTSLPLRSNPYHGFCVNNSFAFLYGFTDTCIPNMFLTCI